MNEKELQAKIMTARQTGVWTLLDRIAEDMQIPKTPQETHFLREKWSHIRWLATKLAASTFGDKSQVEQKIDNHLIISWGEPKNENNIIQAKEVMDQVSGVDVKAIPGTNSTHQEEGR